MSVPGIPTRLAADYARTTWQAGELDVSVWVTATSRQAVVARYAQAATELLAHIFMATAINLIRLDAWGNGSPLAPTRTSHLAALDLAA